MRNLSIEKLIEINKLFNNASGFHVIKHEGVVIVTFYDHEGELDSTVLTPREYELVRIDFYIETLNEIVDLVIDKRKMEVIVSAEIENFPIKLVFKDNEYYCNFQEYRYILEEVELVRN
ncbi:hypothetical protein Q75_02845 [Bacillus coahuilensis p1.1.43]|uniref:Uncharacterized protein n=1 Tax=Bacillus coahuilensis p1.1.43 TaxID=1150625 RepID=A0A147KBH9_9BACI|nr:hypothetical protein [Bacillus coahuilensis]KUP08451.1 hypothetical protein Q75_02845 [Bacillus coahuilensis p1.1.43]